MSDAHTYGAGSIEAKATAVRGKVAIHVDPRRGESGPWKAVEAFVVAGEGGVFATWKTVETDGREIIHMASGDDGHWWEIKSFHVYWTQGLMTALELAAKDEM